MRTVPGVKILRDARGRETAVVIDLKRHRALWEDFADVAIAKARTKEPTESLVAVRAKLLRAGRLARSA